MSGCRQTCLSWTRRIWAAEFRLEVGADACAFLRHAGPTPTRTPLGGRGLWMVSLERVFTGIVRERGTIAFVEGDADGVRLVVEAPATAEATALGDSVAIDG